MGAKKIKFQNAEGYEKMMGVWSQLVGSKFLEWLNPEKHQKWIDIGCGGGAFTEQLMENCFPSYLVGVDPSRDQLDFARQRPGLERAVFHQADAMDLPFESDYFDAATMALVLFFVPDPTKAVEEMIRVTKPSAFVSAYVWDIHDGGWPGQPIRTAFQDNNIYHPIPPSSDISKMENLKTLWSDLNLHTIKTQRIVVERTFNTFDEFWNITSNSAGVIAALSELQPESITQLKTTVRTSLPTAADGSITYQAFANAIQGQVNK